MEYRVEQEKWDKRFGYALERGNGKFTSQIKMQ